MAEGVHKKKKHKEWRKEVKKLRRKKIRQKLAEERNKKLDKENAILLADPQYQTWLKDQKELEEMQLEQEERHRQEQEELWMRRELLAKKKFREEQRKYEATVAIKEAERILIQKEFEELQQKAQKRREERKQREEQAKKDHEQMLARIAEYIEFGGDVPGELIGNVQSNPNKQLCPFFSKTNACRFAIHCSRNHIRPKLSKILFFPNFFSHIKLEQSKDTEYGCDINLECTENELNDDYVVFFDDVIEELKKYGEIMNFRTCMNSQPHLRGNVLVEYFKERDALKAYMELQGRYYASRQINVEFSPIITWKSAICGLSYTKKCPKGRDCNFLHIFKNPRNMYNISVFKQEEDVRKINRRVMRDSSIMSWNDGDNLSSSRRHWRWSESPEPYPPGSTNDSKRSVETSSRKRKESPWSSSRPRRSRSSERKLICDRKDNRSKSNSSYRDSRRKDKSSSKQKNRSRSRSKGSHKSSFRKRHSKSDPKKHHKDKKRKHKSKRSRS